MDVQFYICVFCVCFSYWVVKDDIKAQEIDREGDEVIDEWLEREHPDRVSREDWGSKYPLLSHLYCSRV